jgi:hypothetical protein
MKIKIEYLKSITKEIEVKKNSLASTMDRYDVVADEEDITNLAEALRYFADLVESIPLA